MSGKNKERDNLKKEKLFQDTVPRSRVQLDVVERVRKAIKSMPVELPSKIISYQSIIKENGEYYLIYQGSSDLKPLVEYLNQKQINSQKLLQEMLEILRLLKDLKLIKKVFPNGINAANFYIDQKENIYLMPEELLQSKRSYNNYQFKPPTAEYFKAPEVIAGEEWQEKSYIFNIAAVFYYFISSETIFGDNDQAKVLNKIQSEKILELKTIVPKISDDLNNIFMEMLTSDKNQRPSLNSLFKKIENTILINNFELQPFLKRDSITDNKTVSRKRKKENIKLFFRQSWKPLLFFTILFISIIWGISSGPAPIITAENSPEEVVNYFYEAIASKNIGLANEAAEFDLAKMERIISESHVIEKMQEAYTDTNSGEKINQVYSLENLRIEKVSSSRNEHVFRVIYEFNFRESEKLYSVKLEDQLLVSRSDDIWRIKEIEGDLAEMIAGKYPWREE